MLARRASLSHRPSEARRRALLRGGGIAVALACLQVQAGSGGLPKELMFVGLTDSEWRLFIGDASASPRRIATLSEPRTPAYSVAHGRIAYVAATGAVHEIDLAGGGDMTLLEPSAERAFTQPAYRPGTDELYIVALKEGSSVDTDIARVDRAAKKATTILHQRSSQFEPSFTKDGARMVYSNVLCASECPKIIQEIWSMEVVGGVAEQITLLNAVSRQATVDPLNRIVFASNKGGYYQLWRVDEAGATPQRLTQEPTVDESPAITDAGDIYFVRRTPTGGRLMRLDVAGQTHRVELGASIHDVRDVRWGR